MNSMNNEQCVISLIYFIFCFACLFYLCVFVQKNGRNKYEFIHGSLIGCDAATLIHYMSIYADGFKFH